MYAGGFVKYEGLGNDFVVIENGPVTRDAAVAMCDRRHGIGADGVIVLTKPTDPANAARMQVLNADGSVPEMCGNGLRCVALHLGQGSFVVETDAGPRSCEVRGDSVRVDMAEVRYLGDRSIDVDGTTLVMAIGDAGNPHAITFGNYTRADLDRLGPLIEKNAAFPKGTNVELASAHGDAIDLLVWERGVGVTLACGTGACATAVVAHAKGLVPARVRVNLLGGSLDIEADPNGRTFMTGPARRVFQGTL